MHKDYNEGNPREFRANLHKSKALLEDLTSSEGYRIPGPKFNSKPIYDRSLLAEGFLYDSSVTPTRSFRGKFGNFRHAPRHLISLIFTTSPGKEIQVCGNSGLFSYFKPPSGSGIMSRIAGYTYTVISLEHTLREGDTVYYFHPYEIGPKPSSIQECPYKSIFAQPG